MNIQQVIFMILSLLMISIIFMTDSYQKLLDHYQPQILTEAINQKLLSPFQYFCVSDVVDLSKLKWSRRGYDIKELENVYTSNTLRSNNIVKSVYKYVTDINQVKGLGFCVSIEHAKYMVAFFMNQGYHLLHCTGM